MRGTCAVVFGVLPFLAMTAALAQTGPAPVQRTVQPVQGTVRPVQGTVRPVQGTVQPFQGMVQPPPGVPAQVVPPAQPLPPTIGSIGGLPVRVWAPVEQPNNQLADRVGAADPLLSNSPSWWATP